MTTATPSRAFSPQTRPSGRGGSLVLHWVKSLAKAKQAARSKDAHAIWIISKSKLANCIAREVATTCFSGKLGYVVLLKTVRLPLLPALEKRFKQVAFPSSALPEEELKSVLIAPDRSDRLVGGTVDEPSKTITLWRGDLKPLIVPFDAFSPTAKGIVPRFNLFSVTDYGNTLKFGEYEAAADAVLYEYDPEFRRRLKQRRFANEDTLGASIRRLRMQRQLTRDDFPEIDPKTLARIENGHVRKPHADTLEIIATRLGIRPEELSSF